MTEFNPLTPPEIKLIGKTIFDWLNEFCCDGDSLQVLKTNGGISLYCKRTNMVYLVGSIK